jgi:KamA family protein
MNYIAYNSKTFRNTIYYNKLPQTEKDSFNILSFIFHFKINNYIIENLIDWENIPDDPIYRLLFPRKEMLNKADYDRIKMLVSLGMGQKELQPFIDDIRKRASPELKQTEHNFVVSDTGMHKGMYRNFETIINLCPEPMVKTCHAYCSYCFRWVMFNSKDIQQMSSYTNPDEPVEYIRNHKEIKDVLFTGADLMTLNTKTIKRYIEPILDIDSVEVIRVGSKSLAWWPHRFVTDKDADELLDMFRYIRNRGKHVNFCAHFTHPNELNSDIVKEAVKRIQDTGAVIRCQGPVVEGINNSAETWNTMWSKQINMGMIPYYMFIEADHNKESCFRIPLAESLKIFQEAQKLTTGLARTVRGPVFINDINRVLLDGTTVVDNKKYFVLKCLQSAPGTDHEGRIKLIPYDEKSKITDNLYNLFSSNNTE